MITKLTSIKSVIAKIIADLDIKEDDIKISDIREWICDGIEKIGAFTQFTQNVDVISIKGHQAKLPCNLHQLHQVAYSFNCDGPWFPMRKATGSFAVWNECDHDCNCTPEMLIKDDTAVNLVVDMIGNINKTEAIELLNTNQNLRTIISNLINKRTTGDAYYNVFDTSNPSIGLQYSVKPEYIMTNVPSGYLKISYSSIPTDEDGYALIPDMTSYTEALYWYVLMKFMYPKLLRGEINRYDYYDIRRSWNFYRNQAYAEALMPNEDGLESIKNNWNKLVPEFRDHNTFYSHTGERQIIYNANEQY